MKDIVEVRFSSEVDVNGRLCVLVFLAFGCSVGADPVKESIVIWSDGTRMAGDLWRPEGLAPDAKVPGLLLVQGWGGTKSQGPPASQRE